MANGLMGLSLALLNAEFLLVGAAFLAGGVAFVGLPRWLPKLRRGVLARAAARVDREARPAASIREAPEALVRLRGRVRVLSPVARPDAGSRRCGAFAFKGLGRFADPSAVAGHCGRIAIEDSTGVAIVDDDCFVLDGAHVIFAPLLVEDGDLVEVAGVGRRAPADEDVDPTVTGYREARTAFVFEGTPEHPVVVRRLSTEPVATDVAASPPPAFGMFWL